MAHLKESDFDGFDHNNLGGGVYRLDRFDDHEDECTDGSYSQHHLWYSGSVRGQLHLVDDISPASRRELRSLQSDLRHHWRLHHHRYLQSRGWQPGITRQEGM